MGRVCFQDARREDPAIGGRIEEVLKKSDVADIMVTVNPGCQLREVCHGLTDAAEVARIGTPLVHRCNDDSPRRSTPVASAKLLVWGFVL